MIIEYIGVADRFAGAGVVHTVRAIWNATTDKEGDVKRKATAAVRKVVGKGGSVAYESRDMDTHGWPTLAAIVNVRVLTEDQVSARKELKSRRYTGCEGPGEDGEGCGQFPGEVVHLRESDTEQALCYGCRTGLAPGSYKVRHWIQRDGRVQIN